MKERYLSKTRHGFVSIAIYHRGLKMFETLPVYFDTQSLVSCELTLNEVAAEKFYFWEPLLN